MVTLYAPILGEVIQTVSDGDTLADTTTYAVIEGGGEISLASIRPKTIRGVTDASATLLDTGGDDIVVPANCHFVAVADTNTYKITVDADWVEETDIAPLINDLLSNGHPVRLPGGYFYIDSTIELPYKSGGLLQGSGRTDILIDDVSAYEGLSTRLLYRGSTSEPAIRVTGSEWDLKDISFYANPVSTGTPPTPIGTGLLMTKTGSGLGTGKLDASGLGFYGFDRGIQFGLLENEGNNDVTDWRRIVFRNCNSCVYVKGTQAMEHVFTKCQFRHECTYGINIAGGGHIIVRDSLVGLPIEFLHYNGDNTTVYRPGVNNRKMIVENLKVDDQATSGGLFKLVTTDVHVPRAEISFIRCQISGTSAWSEGNIDDSMTLTIDDCAYTSANVTPFTVSAL